MDTSYKGFVDESTKILKTRTEQENYQKAMTDVETAQMWDQLSRSQKRRIMKQAQSKANKPKRTEPKFTEEQEKFMEENKLSRVKIALMTRKERRKFFKKNV